MRPSSDFQLRLSCRGMRTSLHWAAVASLLCCIVAVAGAARPPVILIPGSAVPNRPCAGAHFKECTHDIMCSLADFVSVATSCCIACRPRRFGARDAASECQLGFRLVSSEPGLDGHMGHARGGRQT